MRRILFQVVWAASMILALSCADNDEANEDVVRHQFREVSALSVNGENYDIVLLNFADGTNKTLTVTCVTTVGYDNELQPGKYTLSNGLTGMTLVPGATDDEGDYGTYLFEDDGAGGGYTRYFTSGSITVANGPGNSVNITIDLVDSLGEKLSAEYKGSLIVVDDGAMTDIVYAEAHYYGVDSGLDLWAILLSTSRSANVACTDILLMFYASAGETSTLPLNVFTMAAYGGNFSANTAIYGYVKNNSTAYGCWYLETPDGKSYNYFVPAVASRGWVKTSSFGDDGNTVYFRFYDSSGNRYSCSYSDKIEIYDRTTRSPFAHSGTPALQLPTAVSSQEMGVIRIPSSRGIE